MGIVHAYILGARVWVFRVCTYVRKFGEMRIILTSELKEALTMGFFGGWVFVKKDFFVKAGCLAGGDISDDIYMLVIVESGTVHEEQSRKDGTV